MVIENVRGKSDTLVDAVKVDVVKVDVLRVDAVTEGRETGTGIVDQLVEMPGETTMAIAGATIVEIATYSTTEDGLVKITGRRGRVVVEMEETAPATATMSGRWSVKLSVRVLRHHLVSQRSRRQISRTSCRS